MMCEFISQEPPKDASDPDADKPLGFRSRWTVIRIVLPGVLLSLGLYLSLRWQEDRHLSEGFRHRSADRLKSIASQFETGIMQLRSIAASMQFYSEMTPNRFRAITDSLLSQNSRMHALSWNARVPAAELATYIANAGKTHAEHQLYQFGRDCALEPVTVEAAEQVGARDLYVVELIEPLEPNRSALGLDISSEPVRRAALEQAIASRRPIATGRIQLVQETGSQYGALLIAPVLKRSRTDTPAAEHRDVAGVVVGVYRIGEAIEAAVDNLEPAGIDICLIDDSASPQQQLLYPHSSRTGRHPLAAADRAAVSASTMVETARLEFGGRQWSLRCTPADNYFSSRRTWFPAAVLCGGLFVTFLTAAHFVGQHRLTDQLRKEILMRAEAERHLAERERALAHISRLSTMGEMVAGIAHEITQPLSAISNFATATGNTLKKNHHSDSTTAQEWLEQITAQALRCGEIIRRLRRFVTRDQQEVQCVDLKKVISDSVALAAYDKRHFSSCIECQLPESSPHVYASEVQLQQVIVNLLRNACDATAESEEPLVCVTLMQLNDCVRLTVADNGTGIDDEHREKVFDTFFTTKPDGMGMGLAISKSIVEAHYGRIWQDDEITQGAAFHIDLPAVRDA